MIVALLILAAPSVSAAEVSNEELQRRLDILSGEVEKLKIGDSSAQADQRQHGLAPGASKVYRAKPGISFGGYGETLYQNLSGKRENGTASGSIDTVDLLRLVLYSGFKFNEFWVLNSEVEFEHGSTDANGSVSVEFAYLDYLMSPELSFRAGLLLVPMGFINEIHEPTAYLGARRPFVERVILPATWQENGAGLHGALGNFTYRSYAVAGLNASDFTATGIRNGRQLGSESNASNGAWVSRVDYSGLPGLLLGSSFYIGRSSTEAAANRGGGRSIPTRIMEAHAELRWRAVQLRVLAAQSMLGRVADLNTALGLTGAGAIGSEQSGAYAELGYDLLSGSAMGLIPFVRFESYGTQGKVPTGFEKNPANHQRHSTIGAVFRPIEQIALKADYQRIQRGDRTGVNQWNLAIGYVF